ncbi:MAG: division/cell wall cluster transcriptional repressor MraZ [Pseudomonadota bacterium]
MSIGYCGMSSVGLDAKGRLSIPTKYREQLLADCDGCLVLSLDRSPNLLMFPLPVWDVLQQELTSIGASDKAVRLRRLYLGSAEHVKMDSAGRVLVSPELRKRIGLETGSGAKKACVVGQGGKFEIWREDTWSEYLDAVMDDAKDLDLGSDDADAQIASRLTML